MVGMTDVRPPLKQLFKDFIMLLDTTYGPNDIIDAADDALDEYDLLIQEKWKQKNS